MLGPLITHCGSIFYPEVQRAQYFARTFAFRPLCFQYFTSRGEGEGGRAPLRTKQFGSVFLSVAPIHMPVASPVLNPAKPSLVSSYQRVALVHDYLNGMRGGEKVLEVLTCALPI